MDMCRSFKIIDIVDYEIDNILSLRGRMSIAKISDTLIAKYGFHKSKKKTFQNAIYNRINNFGTHTNFKAITDFQKDANMPEPSSYLSEVSVKKIFADNLHIILSSVTSENDKTRRIQILNFIKKNFKEVYNERNNINGRTDNTIYQWFMSTKREEDLRGQENLLSKKIAQILQEDTEIRSDFRNDATKIKNLNKFYHQLHQICLKASETFESSSNEELFFEFIMKIYENDERKALISKATTYVQNRRYWDQYRDTHREHIFAESKREFAVAISDYIDVSSQKMGINMMKHHQEELSVICYNLFVLLCEKIISEKKYNKKIRNAKRKLYFTLEQHFRKVQSREMKTILPSKRSLRLLLEKELLQD